MTQEFLGDGNTDGSTFGQNVSEVISLWGVTPVIQPLASAQAAVTTATIAGVTQITPAITQFGFTTAQALALIVAVDALATRVNSNSALVAAMRTAMVNFGAMKGSA